MNGNELKLSMAIRNGESVRIIKFIGRLHSSLVDILDNVNSCFSFQVCKNI